MDPRLSRALDTIRRTPGLSRHDLAAELGVSVDVASQIVTELRRRRLVQPAGYRPASVRGPDGPESPDAYRVYRVVCRLVEELPHYPCSRMSVVHRVSMSARQGKGDPMTEDAVTRAAVELRRVGWLRPAGALYLTAAGMAACGRWQGVAVAR